MSATSSFHINCSTPVSDNLFTLSTFVEYLNNQMKVGSLRHNLHGKITVEADSTNSAILVTTNVKYSKRSIRYYTRKFLQKQGLHQRFRVVAVSKDSYEIRQYGPTSKE